MSLVIACGVFLASVVARAGAPASGNHAVEPAEARDGGDQTSGDGCDATCPREPVCGDGIKEGKEECDDGNRLDGDSCDATCHLERACCCGNGWLDPGEECDDGDDIDDDGCSTSCKIDPMWRRQVRIGVHIPR